MQSFHYGGLKSYGKNSTVFAKQNYCVYKAKLLCLQSKITVSIK